MGWNVGVLEENVKISKSKVKKANAELAKYIEYGYGGLFDEDTGELVIDYDAQEHIDPIQQLSDDTILVLLKYKPKGKLLFSSSEGDNKGDAWGYEFDGKGGVKYLDREVKWVVTGERSA